MVAFRTLARASAALGALTLACAPAPALNIVLVKDKSFDAAPGGAAALYAFQKAANYWNQTISTDVTLKFDIHYGPLDDGILGGTYSNAVNTTVASVYGGLGKVSNSALDKLAVANLRPLTDKGGLAMRTPAAFNANGTGLDTDKPSVYDNNDTYNNLYLNTNTAINRALGLDIDRGSSYFQQINDFYGKTVLNSASDADITFSSNFNFDYDPTDGISAGTYDFLGVAIHEMGHALGFVSGVDDYDYYAYPNGPGFKDFLNENQNNSAWGSSLDLFRYGVNAFAPDGSRALQWDPGRDAYFSINGDLPFNFGPGGARSAFFSTGTFNGDKQQASHWLESKAIFYPNGCVVDDESLGIMDPTAGACVNSALTSNDLAAFDAMGWNLGTDVLKNLDYSTNSGAIYQLAGLATIQDAVPEPSTWATMLAGFGAMGVAFRRRRKLAAA